jgi:hypothetical protein
MKGYQWINIDNFKLTLNHLTFVILKSVMCNI